MLISYINATFCVIDIKYNYVYAARLLEEPLLHCTHPSTHFKDPRSEYSVVQRKY